MGAPKQNPETGIITRSERMKSQDTEVNSFVRFALQGQNHVQGRSADANDALNNAQFSDISETGMRIVARHPTSVHVGDRIEIEFTVPGTNETIVSAAQVVRKTTEFVFAVRFINVPESHRLMLAQAISQQFEFARWSVLLKPVAAIKQAIALNRQGLLISILALVCFGVLGGFIFLNSDEYKGRSLRTWTAPYPKQWDLDYVKKFNGAKDTNQQRSDDNR